MPCPESKESEGFKVTFNASSYRLHGLEHTRVPNVSYLSIPGNTPKDSGHMAVRV
jgi:hypothetical protein